MRTARTLAAAALLALTAAGCSADDITDRIAEEAAEQAGGGDVDIDSGDGTISIESSEGSMQMGSGGSVPDSFPDDMPLPEGDFEVVNSFEQTGGDGLEVQMAVQVDASFEELSAYFTEQLPENGWEVVNEQRSQMEDLQSVTLAVEDDGGRGGIVTVTKSGEDPTMVNYGLGTRG